MSRDRSVLVGKSGRYLIYIGVIWPVIGGITCLQDQIVAWCGDNALPYVAIGILIFSGVTAMSVYDRIPSRIATRIGFAGWFTGISLLYWYFWFGPGSLKMK